MATRLDWGAPGGLPLAPPAPTHATDCHLAAVVDPMQGTHPVLQRLGSPGTPLEWAGLRQGWQHACVWRGGSWRHHAAHRSLINEQRTIDKLWRQDGGRALSRPFHVHLGPPLDCNAGQQGTAIAALEQASGQGERAAAQAWPRAFPRQQRCWRQLQVISRS